MSDGGVHRHEEVEAVLYWLQKDLAVIDVDVEFAFEGVVDEDASPQVDVVVLTVPVCLEGNGHSIPPLWVSMAKAVSNWFYNALC